MDEGSRQIIFQDGVMRRFLIPIIKSEVHEQLDFKSRFDHLAASGMGVHDNFFDKNGSRHGHMKGQELTNEYYGAQLRLKTKQGTLDFGDGGKVADEILINTVAIGRFKTTVKEEGIFITFSVKTDGAGRTIYDFIRRVKGMPIDLELTRADEAEEERLRKQVGQGELFNGEGEGEGEGPKDEEVDAALEGLEALETGKESTLEAPGEAESGGPAVEAGSKPPASDEWPVARQDGTFDPDAAERRLYDGKDGSQARIFWLEMVSGFMSDFEVSFTVGNRTKHIVTLREPVYPSERQAISQAAKGLVDFATAIITDKDDKTINKKQRDECRRIITWAAQYVEAAVNEPPAEDESDAAEA